VLSSARRIVDGAHDDGADRAMLIGTGGFSQGTLGFADRNDAINISESPLLFIGQRTA
jgi:hypothetical protein